MGRNVKVWAGIVLSCLAINYIFYHAWTSVVSSACVSPSTLRARGPATPHTPDSSRKHYVCMFHNAGLGNRMFAYASSYGIAMDKNMSIAVVENRKLKSIFEIDAVEISKKECNEMKLRKEKKCCSYDETLANFTVDSNYTFKNFLISWKYFQNHIPAIRKQFTFNEVYLEKAQKYIRDVLREYKRRTYRVRHGKTPTLIGVHVRLDVMNERNQRQGYAISSKKYIIKAMNYFARRFSNAIFLICTDSLDWVKSNFKSTNIFYSVDNSPEVDLSILASCNHSVMTVGTFGWWGSFLAGGETVYYKHPTREGSQLRKQYSSDYSDYFYKGWIGMD